MKIKKSKIKTCKDCKRIIKGGFVNFVKMPSFCIKHLVIVEDNNHCKYFKRKIVKLDKLSKILFVIK